VRKRQADQAQKKEEQKAQLKVERVVAVSQVMWRGQIARSSKPMVLFDRCTKKSTCGARSPPYDAEMLKSTSAKHTKTSQPFDSSCVVTFHQCSPDDCLHWRLWKEQSADSTHNKVPCGKCTTWICGQVEASDCVGKLRRRHGDVSKNDRK
jgi:hypothetical protein